jgi:hypothetical protein
MAFPEQRRTVRAWCHQEGQFITRPSKLLHGCGSGQLAASGQQPEAAAQAAATRARAPAAVAAPQLKRRRRGGGPRLLAAGPR